MGIQNREMVEDNNKSLPILTVSLTPNKELEVKIASIEPMLINHAYRILGLQIDRLLIANRQAIVIPKAETGFIAGLRKHLHKR